MLLHNIPRVFLNKSNGLRSLGARVGAVAVPVRGIHKPFCGKRSLSLIPICNKTDIAKRPQPAL